MPPQRLEVSISRVPAAEGTNNGVHQGRPLRGRSRAQTLRDDLLSFDTTLSTSCSGLSAGRTLNEVMVNMSKQLRYIISVIIIVLAAALSASAQSISVDLAEKTPPADLVGGLDPVDPPSTTTTTTTTLPTIPRCPDGIAGATTGSQDGYNYWNFDDDAICHPIIGYPGTATIYCFENPYVDSVRSDRVDWKLSEEGRLFYGFSWDEVASRVIGAGPYNPETCYICGCFRAEGCFAPGVKITMADGSLRKIEDVRAGDMVRNAKTDAPVRVRQVIEGPEALPLIRFGFEGTTVTTSQAHPVLTAAGLKPANELKKGDTIFDAGGNPHPLTILETLPLEEGQRVINVNLDVPSSDAADGRLIISDGIVTGDIVLQGLLRERK